MSKQIRVSDAAYAVLTREAKANHRSILADQVDAMVLDRGLTKNMAGANDDWSEPSDPTAKRQWKGTKP